MKNKLTFGVHISEHSNHWVHVVVHTTARAMRSLLTRRKHKDSQHTAACCWQSKDPTKDNCFAEIHLAADILTLDQIAHESTHAAWHRTTILGIKMTEERFEEWVAEDTGRITDAILAYLDNAGIRVRYACALKRSATKRYVKK